MGEVLSSSGCFLFCRIICAPGVQSTVRPRDSANVFPCFEPLKETIHLSVLRGNCYLVYGRLKCGRTNNIIETVRRVFFELSTRWSLYFCAWLLVSWEQTSKSGVTDPVRRGCFRPQFFYCCFIGRSSFYWNSIFTSWTKSEKYKESVEMENNVKSRRWLQRV